MAKDVRPIDSFAMDQQEFVKTVSLGEQLEATTILGSGSLRRSLYSSDIDAFSRPQMGAKDKPTAAKQAARALQEVVARVIAHQGAYIADVKLGEQEECRVLAKGAGIRRMRVHGYKQEDAVRRVHEIQAAGLITGEEAAEGLKALENAGPVCSWRSFLKLRDIFKWHVLRWDSAALLAGEKVGRGDRVFGMAECFLMPAVAKADFVSFFPSTGTFRDVSVIYEVRDGSGRILNHFNKGAASKLDVVASVATDALMYADMGKYAKVCKRSLSIARMLGMEKQADELMDAVNSPWGLLYQVGSEIGTLEFLAKHESRLPHARIALELEAMVPRVSMAWGVRGVLTHEDEINSLLREAEDVTHDAAGAAKMLTLLGKVQDIIGPAISAAAKMSLVKMKLLDKDGLPKPPFRP